jgi:cellulose synthase operon protein C
MTGRDEKKGTTDSSGASDVTEIDDSAVEVLSETAVDERRKRTPGLPSVDGGKGAVLPKAPVRPLVARPSASVARPQKPSVQRTLPAGSAPMATAAVPSSQGRKSIPPPLPVGATPAPAPVAASSQVRKSIPPPLPPRSERRSTPPADAASELGVWSEPYLQLLREAEALKTSRPEHGAWLLVIAARIAYDVCEDVGRAEAQLAKADKLAPSSRVVAASRRWVAECAGRLPDVLKHAKTELDRAATPAERVELLCRMASLEEFVGNKPEAAEAFLKEAVSIDPTDLASSLSLSASYARRARWADTASLWEQMASHISDPEVKAAWLASAGAVKEVLLSDVAGARAAYERAIAADANDMVARAALEPLLHRAKAWESYALLLLAQGQQLETEPTAACLMYERSGDVLWEAANDAQGASKSYELASGVMATEPGPMLKLAAVLEAIGDTPRLEAAYGKVLSLARDPMLRATVFFKLGVLAESTGQSEKAMSAYESSLAAVPTFCAAAESLEALCISAGHWERLVRLLQVEAERVTLPAQRAARYVRIADIYGGQLRDVDQAVAWCQRALSLDPSQLLAFDLLERILRERNDPDTLAALYEKAGEAARDPRLGRALKLELASLHLAARRAERAAPLLAGALGEQDELPVLMQLARALSDSGQWAELISVLESQAKLMTHPPTLVAALYRIAVMIETRLGDAGRALAAYAKVLERASDHEGALEGMLRIQVGQSNWEEAVRLEHRLAALATRPEDAASRLYRAGWILEARLGRLDDATAAYEASLSKLPAYVPAALALERTLRSGGKAPRLAAMYETRSALQKEGADKASELVNAARIYELRLGDTQKALQALDRALTASPGFEPAIWARLRLHEVIADWRACSSDLRSLISVRTEPSTRAALLSRAARVHELHLDEANRAAILLEEAMSCGSGRRALVSGRLRMALCAPAAAGAQRWLSEASSHTSDRAWAGAVSRLRMFALMFGNAPLADVEEACSRTLAHRPGDGQALQGLASVLLRRRELVGAVPVLVRAARQEENTPARAMMLVVAAAMAEGNGDRAGALDVYNESLRAMTDNIAALHGLRRLAGAAGDWREVVQSCERIAGLASDPTNMAEAWLEAGDVHLNRLNAPEPAVNAWRAVLAKVPDHVAAFERAASVLETGEQWGQLAGLMAEHLSALRDEPRRVSVLQRRAAVLSDRMGRIHDAINEMEKATRSVPAPELVRTLAQLYERDRQWQNAVQSWQHMVSIATEPSHQAEALLQQATLLSVQLGEYEQARAILEPLASAQAPMPREGFVRLAEVYAHLGEARSAREMFRRLGTSGSAEDRVDAWLSAAAIADKDLGDHAGMQEAIEQALEVAITEPSVMPTIEGFFQQTGTWQRFVAIADRVSDRAPKKSAGKLALRMAVARAYRSRLRSPELADMHLRATVEMFPGATEPRLALGFGLVGSNDKGALEELRAAIQVDPFCQEAYQAIASICHRTGFAGAAAYAATAAAMFGDDKAEVAGAGALEPLPNSLLADDALSLLVGQTRARGLRRVAVALDSQVHTVFPVAPDVLASVSRVADTYPAAVGVRAVAAGLGCRPVNVMRGGQRAITVLLTETRGLVFGAEQVTGAGFAQGMFEACWMLACVSAGSSMIHGLPRSQWLGLLVAATESNGQVTDPEFRKRVMAALPRRTRKDLERITEEETIDARAEYPVWELEERSRALRAAVALTRDMRVAARSLAPKAMASARAEERKILLSSNELLAEALRFCVSDACWAVHHRLFGRR